MTGSDVRWLEELTNDDVGQVGGKNASLGEMIQHLAGRGIQVPAGFATTAEAYRRFLHANDLDDPIAGHIDDLHRGTDLAEVGAAIRELFLGAEFPAETAEAITHAYAELGERLGRSDPDVAVRSSATAEDLPEASFAGQQESFLNVVGPDVLLDACRRCYASLFTDRAISYREHHGFDHLDVALSVGVQQMVRSDSAGAGVMFTLDTDSGFPRAVLINAAFGLGESVVAGLVEPDEYVVFKPLLDREELTPIVSKTLGAKATKIVCRHPDVRAPDDTPTETVETDAAERARFVLSDDEICQLARWAIVIEDHYGKPMDIEWAKDGDTGDLHIVQARPETVQARQGATIFRSYHLSERGEVLIDGLAVGDAIATGKVQRLDSATDIGQFRAGNVLVTGATDPDWEPIMKQAAAIVTDHGGRTSHAAIVSRELGVTAIVGAGDATTRLTEDTEVTVSCAEGDTGYVYAGTLAFTERDIDLDDVPETETEVMLNVADPAAAFRWWRLPADGVGLARMEFVINNHIKIHPMALVRYDQLEPGDDKHHIDELTRGYDDKTTFFVDRLADGIGRIAAAWWPKPVIVRLSDFKTNEYARLLGGDAFEPTEENPMLGWRGASRYAHPDYADGFALECAAISKVRDTIGLTNVVVMIPFCRTLAEADEVLDTMGKHALRRGDNDLQVYVMAEIPSNVILAAEFAERFDGFSIGSNDLTQLVLGVDRDSERLADIFDERNPAVTRMIASLIDTAHDNGRKVGICGQRPSDDAEFAGLLVRSGIDSISVTPDSFLRVKANVAAAESE